jgi:tRNA (guanine-N7-)-methyltransferase
MFNPLATPLSDPGCTGLTQSWSTLFHDPGLPLHIDLGCARGRLVFELAAMHKDRNYIGIEVRDKLVIEANRTIELNRLSNPTEYKGNCTFVCANMLNEKHREQLEQSLSQYPGTVERISILFPDPWIKKKHRERRIVQTHVLESVHRTLRPGGELVIASDVEDLMIEAKGKLEQLAGLFVAKPGRLVVKPTPTLTKASTTTTARGDVSSTGEMVIGTDVPALPNEEIINDVNDVGGSKDAATAMTNSNSNSSSRSSSNSNESIISALDGRRTTITKGGREAAVSGTVNEVENKVENEVEDVEVDESGYVLTNPFHPLASEREQVRVKS